MADGAEIVVSPPSCVGRGLPARWEADAPDAAAVPPDVGDRAVKTVCFNNRNGGGGGGSAKTFPISAKGTTNNGAVGKVVALQLPRAVESGLPMRLSDSCWERLVGVSGSVVAPGTSPSVVRRSDWHCCGGCGDGGGGWE
jgi:hypothetical protein